MKKSVFSLSISLLILLISTSCTYKLNEQEEMAQLQKAISENENAWNNLDVEKIVGMFAENGTLLNDNSEMLRGKNAIKKYFDTMVKTEELEFKRDKVEVSMKGNMAYEIVNQTVSFKYPGKESQTEINKYIHLWEKQGDGSWKVLIDMNNSRSSSTE